LLDEFERVKKLADAPAPVALLPERVSKDDDPHLSLE